MRDFTTSFNMRHQRKGLVIKDKIKNLKLRIEQNYQELDKEYGDNCELATHIIKIIDLLLSKNVSDDKIEKYLKDINSAIVIIEEKLARVEQKTKNNKSMKLLKS